MGLIHIQTYPSSYFNPLVHSPAYMIEVWIIKYNNNIILYIPYSWKYWWELNFVVRPKIVITKMIISRFKLGTLVRDHHVYYTICKQEVLADFYLAVTTVVSSPDPTPKGGKGLGTLALILGSASSAIM